MRGERRDGSSNPAGGKGVPDGGEGKYRGELRNRWQTTLGDLNEQADVLGLGENHQIRIDIRRLITELGQVLSIGERAEFQPAAFAFDDNLKLVGEVLRRERQERAGQETVQVIFPEHFIGQPEKAGQKDQLLFFVGSTCEITGQTDYGGAGSKYNNTPSNPKHGVNEDSLLAGADDQGNEFAAVIDGIGGGGRGWESGKVANETTAVALRRGESIINTLVEAGLRIKDATGKDGGACGVVARVNKNGTAELGWSGDCRVMTFDQEGTIVDGGKSTVQNEAAEKLGDSARYYTDPGRSIVTGSLSTENGRAPGYARFEVRNGYQVVLGSDGFWDVVTSYEVSELASQYKGQELQEKLFALAYERNNSKAEFIMQYSPTVGIKMLPRFKYGDNISVIVMEVKNVKE